jgi:hypothetical protein
MITLSMCYFSGIRRMAVSLWVIERCFGLGGRSAPSFKLRQVVWHGTIVSDSSKATVHRRKSRFISFFCHLLCPSALASHGPSNVHCNPSLDTYHTPQQHTSLLVSFLRHFLRPSALASHGSSNVHCNPSVNIYRTPQQHTSLLVSFLRHFLRPSALASHGSRL